MKNVPHWQLLLLLYFVMVAVPVYGIHVWFKIKCLKSKTLTNVLVYVVAVIGVAFLMNFVCMNVYYKFIFKS